VDALAASTDVDRLKQYLEHAELCAGKGCELCRRDAPEYREALRRAQDGTRKETSARPDDSATNGRSGR
jgi:hypothetical protein